VRSGQRAANRVMIAPATEWPTRIVARSPRESSRAPTSLDQVSTVYPSLVWTNYLSSWRQGEHSKALCERWRDVVVDVGTVPIAGQKEEQRGGLGPPKSRYSSVASGKRNLRT